MLLLLFGGVSSQRSVLMRNIACLTLSFNDPSSQTFCFRENFRRRHRSASGGVEIKTKTIFVFSFTLYLQPPHQPPAGGQPLITRYSKTNTPLYGGFNEQTVKPIVAVFQHRKMFGSKGTKCWGALGNPKIAKVYVKTGLVLLHSRDHRCLSLER
uniref:Secreted protein n=1 Tax=Steinernema glaseri TaxID=37863 RepID=A0A1I7YIM0_9BILA